MNLKITYRGMDKDVAVEKHIEQQLKKIEDFVDQEHGPVYMELIIEKNSKFPNFQVNARMHMPICHHMAEHEGVNIYEEINMVMDRIYRDVVKAKEERVDKKKHGCDGECRNESYLKDEAAAEFEVEEFIDLEDKE
jgi:ribosomal subunit interface protein